MKLLLANSSVKPSTTQLVKLLWNQPVSHSMSLAMKLWRGQLIKVALLLIAAFAPSLALAAKDAPLVYINQNIGFNVKGYKYNQSEFPCDIDKVLVKNLISRAKKSDIRLEAVSTADKIQNGVVPVLAIDIEQLVLGDRDHQFGIKQDNSLPKVQITAALIKGKDDMVIAKHTCAIMSLNEFSPTTEIIDLGSNGVTVCDATRKCLRDLSKDVVAWMAPQLH
jgi:hypothetical protein